MVTQLLLKIAALQTTSLRKRINSTVKNSVLFTSRTRFGHGPYIAEKIDFSGGRQRDSIRRHENCCTALCGGGSVP